MENFGFLVQIDNICTPIFVMLSVFGHGCPMFYRPCTWMLNILPALNMDRQILPAFLTNVLPLSSLHYEVWQTKFVYDPHQLLIISIFFYFSRKFLQFFNNMHENMLGFLCFNENKDEIGQICENMKENEEN